MRVSAAATLSAMTAAASVSVPIATNAAATLSPMTATASVSATQVQADASATLSAMTASASVEAEQIQANASVTLSAMTATASVSAEQVQADASVTLSAMMVTASVTAEQAGGGSAFSGSSVFDGTNDYATWEGTGPDITPFTFKAWIKITTAIPTAQGYQIVRMTPDLFTGSPVIHFNVGYNESTSTTAGTLVFQATGVNIIQNGVITFNEWWCVGFVIQDDGDVTVYWREDGATSWSTATGTITSVPTPGFIRIGAYNNGAEKFNGNMTSIATWQRDFSSTELLDESNSRDPVITTNIWSYWPLGDGAEVADEASTHNLTVTGALGTSADEPTDLAA